MKNQVSRIIFSACTAVLAAFGPVYGAHFFSAPMPVTSPTITTHPAVNYICQPNANPITIGVVAVGASPTYKWQYLSSNGVTWLDQANGVGFAGPYVAGGTYSGATTPTLTITGHTPNTSFSTSPAYYRCVVTDGTGTIISNDGLVYFYSTPVITSHPANVAKCSGSSGVVTFGVGVTYQLGFTYQWQIDQGSGFVDMTNTAPYAGVFTASLTIASGAVNSSMNGYKYRCHIGKCSPAVYSNPATLTVDVTPTIKTHPTDDTVCAGMNSGFSVSDSGNAVTYQWQEYPATGTFTNLTNNAMFSGVTTNSLTITGVTAGMDTYRYRCVLTSGTCNITSNQAFLYVSGVPTFNNPLLPQQICSGGSASFTLSGINNALGVYQWQADTTGTGTFVDLVNNATYSGVKTNTLVISNGTPSMNNDIFRLGAGKCVPVAVSDTGLLTLGTMPVLTSLPTSQTICVDQNGKFIVAAVGGALSYQWQTDGGLGSANWGNITNGGVYSGATNDTLLLTVPGMGYNNYKFRCIVKNGACTDITNDAVLTVIPAMTASAVTISLLTNNDPQFTFMGFVSNLADTANWNFGDGAIYPFSPVGSNLSQSHTYTLNGTYTVCLSARTACDTITKCMPIVVSGVGIEEYLLYNSISIFPIPNGGEFTIKNDSPDDVEIELQNIIGDRITSFSIARYASKTIDSHLLPGMYMVKITNEDGVSVARKIVVER